MNIFQGKTQQEAMQFFHRIKADNEGGEPNSVKIMAAVNEMYLDFLRSGASEQGPDTAVPEQVQSEQVPDTTLKAILDVTGLDWSVRQEDVKSCDSGLEIPHYKAIINEGSGKPLGIMGDKYTLVQNSETLKTILESGKDYFDPNGDFSHPWDNAETLGSYGNIGGGSLKEGRKVFFQMQLQDAQIGKSGIKRYITATNSHDGSTSFGFGTTNQVICCKNTFAIANSVLSKMKHTLSIEKRINEAICLFQDIIEAEKRQMEIFTKAANTRIQQDSIASLKNAVFPKFDLNDFSNNSTRSQNQMRNLERSILTSFDEQDESLWGLFNGVTRYTNHDAPALNASTEDITYNLMFGTLAKQNRAAYEWLKLEV